VIEASEALGGDRPPCWTSECEGRQGVDPFLAGARARSPARAPFSALARRRRRRRITRPPSPSPFLPETLILSSPKPPRHHGLRDQRPLPLPHALQVQEEARLVVVIARPLVLRRRPPAALARRLGPGQQRGRRRTRRRRRHRRRWRRQGSNAPGEDESADGRPRPGSDGDSGASRRRQRRREVKRAAASGPCQLGSPDGPEHLARPARKPTAAA
jgi:hypothetical protein